MDSSPIKICVVCGDKALGYNFNAITCESCKAFFRRNALSPKRFKCLFEGHCEVNVVTRRFCPCCRLQKCFKAGMKTEYIMSEEDKVLKKKKIAQNKAKERKTSLPVDNIDVKKERVDNIDVKKEHVDTQVPHVDTTDIEACGVDTIRGMLVPGDRIVSCNDGVAQSNKKTSTDDVAKDTVQQVEKVPVEPNSIESILCEAIKLEFGAFSSLAQFNSSNRELNDAERAKLNELIVANKALCAPLDEDLTNLVDDHCRYKTNHGQQEPMLLGVINLTAVAIRRLIKMAKKISAFKNMCQEDQVALLKGGCTEMMILRSAMTYDCDRDTWKIPHIQEAMSNIKADVLKLAKGNVYQEHEKFIRTFDQRWRMDENIILIMCAITLFTPDRPMTVHSDVIKLEQNSYYYLLRRYLESVYSGCEAKSTFLKLIQKISELHRLNNEVISVYLDVNPSQVEPLLIEIFDIKSR